MESIAEVATWTWIHCGDEHKRCGVGIAGVGA